MGVRGLLTYLRSCHVIKYADMNISNQKIGLDGFSLLFLFKENREAFRSYLESMKLRGKLMFVMDKRAAKEKKEVVEKRKEARKEAKESAESLEATILSHELDDDQRKVLEKMVAEKQRQAWCLYSGYLKWLMGMLEELDIDLLWAENEADEVLATGDYDIIVSSDSDFLILGVRRLWLPRGVSIQHNEIDSQTFQKFIGLDKEKLFQLAYLAGCDVQPKSLMSVKEAISRLKFYGGIEEIHRRHPEFVSEIDLLGYNNLRKTVWRDFVV